VKLSGWASRILALAILVAAVGFLQLMVGQPLIDSFIEHRESIGRSQKILAKYQQLNTTREQLRSRLKEVKTAHKSGGLLLTGGNAQLAGAKLQNSLKSLIELNKAGLGSMQLLPVAEEEGFQRVSMVVNFKATTESLQAIIYEIETQAPYLFVDKLELRNNRAITSRTINENPDELQVRLEIFGYMPSDAQ